MSEGIAGSYSTAYSYYYPSNNEQMSYASQVRADFSQIEEETAPPPSLAQGAMGGAFSFTSAACDCHGTGDEDADGDSMPDEYVSDALDVSDTVDEIDSETTECEIGSVRLSYSGPAGTEGIGVCQPQIEECQAMEEGARWQIIQEEILPSDEICNGLDDNCDGQTDEEWHKIFFTGSYTASSVQQTIDGGYILASSNFLIKTDASGNFEWHKHFFGENNEDISSVEQTLDGGYIMAGSTRPAGEGTEGTDAWLLKTDSSGNEEWNRIFDGADTNADWFSSAQPTTDGGYIAAGVTGGSYGTGNANFWLMKTNALGDTEWDKIFDGGNLDYASWVQQTSDGGYILAGATGFSFGGAEDADGWLIKTDVSGNEEWSQIFGGSSNDYTYSVQQTTDGGYILAGTTNSFGAGREDLWLLKTDALGNKEWDKTFGGEVSDYASSAQQTTDGGYILFGTTNSFSAGVYSGDLWLIKTDVLGNTEWEIIRDIDNHDSVSSGQQTSDGGYVVAGHAGFYADGILLAKTCPPSE